MAEYDTSTENGVRRAILHEIELRWRFSKANNLLKNPPTPQETWAAMYDARDDINSFEPQTSFGLLDIYNSPDFRWRNLLYFGTGRHLIRTIMVHWAAEGFDASAGDLNLPDRLPNYEGLYGTFTDEFNTLLERLKLTSQRFVRGIAGKGKNFIDPYGGRYYSWWCRGSGR